MYTAHCMEWFFLGSVSRIENYGGLFWVEMRLCKFHHNLWALQCAANSWQLLLNLQTEGSNQPSLRRDMNEENLWWDYLIRSLSKGRSICCLIPSAKVDIFQECVHESISNQSKADSSKQSSSCGWDIRSHTCWSCVQCGYMNNTRNKSQMNELNWISGSSRIK